MLGTKHIATNKLSQRPCTKLDNINKINKVNINNFINTKLNVFSITLVIAKEANTNLLINKYLKDSQQITRYLITLQKLARINKTKFQSFKHKALQYVIADSNLY